MPFSGTPIGLANVPSGGLFASGEMLGLPGGITDLLHPRHPEAAASEAAPQGDGRADSAGHSSFEAPHLGMMGR